VSTPIIIACSKAGAASCAIGGTLIILGICAAFVMMW